MEGVNGVQIGDEFVCKRRGHTVKVEGFQGDLTMPNMSNLKAIYHNARGEKRMISLKRLKSSGRFEPRVTHATLPSYGESA